MKLLMILMFIFQSITPANQALNDFNEDIDKGYQSYIVVKEESHQYYDLKIIQGINNDKISLGIMLYNVNPKSHEVKLFINNRQYDLPKSKRGDYNISAIKYSDDLVINIVNEKSSKTIAEINYLTVDEFLTQSEGLLTGEGQGVKFTSLSGSKINLGNITTLSLIFGGVIICVSIIIFIFFKRKKGVFSEEKRKDNVFNYREYLNDLVANQDNETYQDDSIIIPQDEVNEEQVKPEKAYERQRFYEDEVDDFIDIEKVLREKGYITDYQIASEEEKNQIMLELMKMRDLHEISQTQYREEIIKLWKK